MSKFTNFLKETKVEFKQVTWPTRSQTINYTLIVLLVSGVIAALLGFFDFLFSLGLSKLLS